jgi:hypothetical protein
MVGFIPLNLRSQEMDKGVPHARAAARAGPGVARRGEAGVVWLCRVNLSVACLFVKHFQNHSPAAE